MSIAEMSVQQTLTRSINTSLTTLLVIGSLYFLGVESIKYFALPLLAVLLQVRIHLSLLQVLYGHFGKRDQHVRNMLKLICKPERLKISN